MENEEQCTHLHHTNNKEYRCQKPAYKKELCKMHYQHVLIKECCEYMENKHGKKPYTLDLYNKHY